MTHMTVLPYSKKWLNILDSVLLTDIIILSLSLPVKMEIVKDYVHADIFSHNLLICCFGSNFFQEVLQYFFFDSNVALRNQKAV